ncbi:hypothetical protein [Spirosoma flavum]|uniref:Uncharacterized protein n=1 Tax=Spirosoma flavum TaxID=2048557 RepID=A0ABW6ACY5_9BACT
MKTRVNPAIEPIVRKFNGWIYAHFYSDQLRDGCLMYRTEFYST